MMNESAATQAAHNYRTALMRASIYDGEEINVDWNYYKDDDHRFYCIVDGERLEIIRPYPMYESTARELAQARLDAFVECFAQDATYAYRELATWNQEQE